MEALDTQKWAVKSNAASKQEVEELENSQMSLTGLGQAARRLHTDSRNALWREHGIALSLQDRVLQPISKSDCLKNDPMNLPQEWEQSSDPQELQATFLSVHPSLPWEPAQQIPSGQGGSSGVHLSELSDLLEKRQLGVDFAQGEDDIRGMGGHT